MIKYLNFKGRINRTELFVLSLILVFLEIIVFLILEQKSIGYTITSSIILFVYLIQCSKRYHDLNKWGINGFVWFIIPIANIFYFFQLYLKNGTNEINKYGKPSNFRLLSLIEKSEDIEDGYYKIEGNITLSGESDLYNKISYSAIQKKLFKKDKEERFINKPIPNIFDIGSVEIQLWHKRNGDYCKKGDKISTLKIRRKFNDEKIDIYSKEEGILKIYKNTYSVFSKNNILDGDLIFEIIKPKGSHLFNTPVIEDDKFNKSQILKWSRVGANNFYEKRLNGFILTLSEHSQRIFVTINNIVGKDYFVINYLNKDFDIKRGDKFQILLESEELINLSFTKNSYLAYESSDENLKKVKETKAIISTRDLQLLGSNKIENWKLSLQSGQEVSGLKPFGCEHAYPTYNDLQEKLQLLFADYLQEVKKIKNYMPTADYDDFEDNSKEECYLYLMIDTTNNYHKIGISNNPEYRERTLQSEKPTIELLASKKFPSRQIAISIEKALHGTFKAKNIRGEWFNLSQAEIDEIKKTLD